MATPDGNQGHAVFSDTRPGPPHGRSNETLPVNDPPRSDLEPNVYRMDRQNVGYAVIINNKEFKDLNERTGTDVDCEGLRILLLRLGFIKPHIQVEKNCTAEEMKDIFQKASERDYTEFNCFFGVVLTHGNKDGDIYGYDEALSLDELTEPFKGNKCHESLVGKPKIFIMQACRGAADGEDAIQKDAFEDESEILDLQIPAEADFLLGFSVIPGYRAWRNTQTGSWYIESLCRVFERRWQTEDVVSMLTEVNKTVAIDYVFNVNIKQMPTFSSTLTKKIHFNKLKAKSLIDGSQ